MRSLCHHMWGRTEAEKDPSDRSPANADLPAEVCQLFVDALESHLGIQTKRLGVVESSRDEIVCECESCGRVLWDYCRMLERWWDLVKNSPLVRKGR